MSLFHEFERIASRYPRSVAVSRRRPDGTYASTTYGDLLGQAYGFAAAYARADENGTHAGSGIIPICAAKSAACAAAMLGALLAGKGFACLNTKLRPPQIANTLEALGTPVALIDGNGLLALRTGLVEDSVLLETQWWMIGTEPLNPVQERVLETLRQAGKIELVPIADAHVPDEAGRGAATPATTAREPQIGCCLFTSGSTGVPKGVLVADEDLRRRAEAERQWYGLSRADVLLALLPWSFDVGLNQLLSGLLTGAELVLLDSWLPADILDATVARRVSGISAVPSIWRAFIDSGLAFDAESDHGSLRYITVSGGDMSPDHLDALPAMAPGVGIFKTYGQTEAFRATSLRPDEFLECRESVGRPFTGVHVYVVDDAGTPVAQGLVGEVVHSGLGVMIGYLNESDSRHKLRANPFQGHGDPNPLAVFTGDMGRLDAEGYLYLEGRSDDMLKISGNRVYPDEISNQLLTLSALSEAQVVGVPDSHGDIELIAFVVLADGASMDDVTLRREAASRLPSFMVPRRVVMRDHLPKTETGKYDRATLTAEARAVAESDSWDQANNDPVG